MGMSASQARFLSLTARKNNVEFEGQQINQQRTTLSNESANYYSELCNLDVPTPPSIDDYTKISYTFNDGAMNSTIISLLPKSGNRNEYVVNYIEEWQDDYAIVPAHSSLIQVDDPTNPTVYSIGNTILRKIGEAPSYVPPSSDNGNTNESSEVNDGGNTVNDDGGVNGGSGSGNVDGGDNVDNGSGVDEGGQENTNYTKHYIDVNENGTPTRYEVFYDSPGYPDGQPYYNKEGGDLSAYERSMIKYYSMSGSSIELKYFVGKSNNIYAVNDIEQKNPVTINENNYIMATEDESQNLSFVGIVDGTYKKLDDNGNPITGERVNISDPTLIIHESIASNNANGMDKAPIGSGNRVLYSNSAITLVSSNAQTSTTEIREDEYWASLTDEQRTALLENEKYLLAMVQEKTGDYGNFYIRYVKNTTTGNYEPYLYAESELEQGQKYNNKNLGSIPCYSLGSTTRTQEVLHKDAVIEKDASGRYVAITIKLGEDSQGNPIERNYKLITTTTTDEEAYNDAMNQYKYKQHEYDHKIQEINSKLEIVQQQDKQLELKLKQLDTEENAISTEMEAVKKVISKNVESSFKTFNA